jgi:hypothetical protein
VDAAMLIGRIVRRSEGFTGVAHDARCFSSCALIYVAGVNRIVDWNASGSGLIGLHRPYFASSPQSRETIEREAPLMMLSLKRYVEEMGLTDNFYREMANTEPSSMILYGNKETGRKNIYQIVPNVDPTYDEVEVSYDARWHGISTAEMRARASDIEPCVGLIFNKNVMDHFNCRGAIAWGLSVSVYLERQKQADARCLITEGERAEIKSVARKNRRDHPIMLRREACVRKTMLGP